MRPALVLLLCCNACVTIEQRGRRLSSSVEQGPCTFSTAAELRPAPFPQLQLERHRLTTCETTTVTTWEIERSQRARTAVAAAIGTAAGATALGILVPIVMSIDRGNPRGTVGDGIWHAAIWPGLGIGAATMIAVELVRTRLPPRADVERTVGITATKREPSNEPPTLLGLDQLDQADALELDDASQVLLQAARDCDRVGLAGARPDWSSLPLDQLPSLHDAALGCTATGWEEAKVLEQHVQDVCVARRGAKCELHAARPLPPSMKPR